MPKHTPGPWRVGSVDKHQVFVPCADCLGPERVLLNMNYHFPYDDDARLIAAAPEVLAALKQIVAEYKSLWDEITDEDFGSPNTPCYARALDVIAKAEGLPPHTPK